jgi:hypothetical protein
LFAVPFDLDRLQVTGNPRRIRDELRLTTDVRTAGTSYAVAGVHALVYVPASAESRSLVWVDRNGRETAINAPARAYWTLKLSPNGQQLAYSDGDLWTLDLVTATSTRLTSDAGTEFLPIWTAEGRRIVYSADRSGAMNLYLANADGSGVARQLTSGTTNVFANSVTHDGTTILGSELRPNTGYDVVRFSVSDGARQVVLGTPAAEFYATLSPDERYLAYQATESGRMEIFARRYPGLDAGRWQVSSEGGQRADMGAGRTRALLPGSQEQADGGARRSDRHRLSLRHAASALRGDLLGRLLQLRCFPGQQPFSHDQGKRARQTGRRHSQLGRLVEWPRRRREVSRALDKAGSRYFFSASAQLSTTVIGGETCVSPVGMASRKRRPSRVTA